MLFPVALTHATEEINWIGILFCTGDFVSLCHPQAQFYLTPKYQGILSCVLIFPPGEAPHPRICLLGAWWVWAHRSLTWAPSGHSLTRGSRLMSSGMGWCCSRLQDCMVRRTGLFPQNLSSCVEHLTFSEIQPHIWGQLGGLAKRSD